MKTATALKEKPAPKAQKAKRIVIVDDHPLFRKGLERLINSSDDAFHICGEAGDAAEGTMHDESLYALRALRAGAQGYVMKQEALENVIVAIREVLAGRPYLSHDMSAKLITNFASGTNEANPTDKLSDRELEILELIGKGRDVHEIAEALHISRKTVETHRAHIKEKLNLKNAREVARFAVQWLENERGISR